METLSHAAPASAAASNEKPVAVRAAISASTHRISLLLTTSVLLAVATAAGASAAANPAYVDAFGASTRHPAERSMRAAVDRSGEGYSIRAELPEGDQEELEATGYTDFEDPVGTAARLPAMLETSEEQEEHDADSQETTERPSRAFNRFRRPLRSALSALTVARAAVAAALAASIALLGWYIHMTKAGMPVPKEAHSAADVDSSQQKQREETLSTGPGRSGAVLHGRLLAMLPGVAVGLAILGAGLLIPIFQSFAAERAAVGLNTTGLNRSSTRTTGIVRPSPGKTTDAVTNTLPNHRRL